MDVMLLAARFIEIVTTLPGLALQTLAVMVLHRTKLFGFTLKTFLMLMVIANIWFSISNFLAAIVTTMEATTFRYGFVLRSNSSFLESVQFYAQYESNHALMIVSMSFCMISIDRIVSTNSIAFHDAHFSKKSSSMPFLVLFICLAAGQIALQYFRIIPFTTVIELVVYCVAAFMFTPILMRSYSMLKSSLNFAELTKKFQMKQNIKILKMVVRLAKLMNLHSASVVILIAIPSTFFPDSTPTALAEGLFYMGQGVFSMVLPIVILKDRAVRSSLRTFSIFRSTTEVLTVRVADASSTTSTMDPPNNNESGWRTNMTGPNRYTLN
ncbi:hypothetical protein PRIPAC_93508 [Pristionchus pacificus]|uniref:Uncharacterized protein n=1 Tax=Pristionchus pacificus TaxID=54126 RepID=A0A2A6BPU5_PRIPA|nr:hypothetical protein PRIPAC_93508 [Pristionchus pacificus]|eukprot:PDM67972.1 hypothetical protein PRIPAC_46016 [Pristionchus pacificus]